VKGRSNPKAKPKRPARAAKRAAKRPAKRPAKKTSLRANPKAAPKRPSRSRVTVTPGEILRPFPPSVRHLAHELRKLIRRTLPKVDERAYDGWHGIGYHDRQSGYLAGIFPQPDCVKVYFEHGAVLPDPHHVLTGTGAQVRHVSCWPDVPVPEQAIRELLANAVRFGAAR
jgi:hypothetical protein